MASASANKEYCASYIGGARRVDLAKAIGLKIRTERKSRKMSQDTLALACNIDRSYMGRIERGEVNITIQKLYVVAMVLACNPAVFLPDIHLVMSDLNAPK